MLDKTVAWMESSEEYKAAYAEALVSASSLGTSLASKVTIPNPVIFTEEYWQSPQRLMIVGQETFGVAKPVISGDPATTFEAQANEVRKFAHAHGLNSPFGGAFGRHARISACHLSEPPGPT